MVRPSPVVGEVAEGAEVDRGPVEERAAVAGLVGVGPEQDVALGPSEVEGPVEAVGRASRIGHQGPCERAGVPSLEGP